MKVDSIKQTIGQFPAKTIEGVNSLGDHLTTFCKEKSDSFTSSKAGEFCKNHNVNKNTLKGTLALLGASYLALKCILGIKNKVKEEIKDKD